MDATLPTLEVVARTVPGTGVEAHMVGVVVPTERDAEAIELDAILLAGIPIRLLDLADERAVHRGDPSVATWTRRGRRPVESSGRPAGGRFGNFTTPRQEARGPSIPAARHRLGHLRPPRAPCANARRRDARPACFLAWG